MIAFAWHVHHDVLFEPLTSPIEERIAYIKAEKPLAEQPLRLRLLHKVQGKLPPPVVKAGAAYGRARVAYSRAIDAYSRARAIYDRTGAAYEEALDAYKEARTSCMPEIEALHTQECPDCPWDGQTILRPAQFAVR